MYVYEINSKFLEPNQEEVYVYIYMYIHLYVYINVYT
jgi:hypothetical protein